MKSNGVTGGLLAPKKNPFYVQRGDLKQDRNWQATSGVAGTQIPSLVGNNKLYSEVWYVQLFEIKYSTAS